MTGLLHEREFSRKAFVKGGGALIVGFSMAGAATAGRAAAQAGAPISPFASPGPGNPNSVDSFLAIFADNTAALRSGRIELGQGSTTGLLMVAAEELDMNFDQLSHVSFDTGGLTPSPNTGNTGGSSSISQGGPLVRMAAAQAKQALLGLASAKLGVPAASLSVSGGVVSGGGQTVTYGQLLGGQLFNVIYQGTTLGSGQAPAKPVSQYTLVGVAPSPPRIDIPSIVVGTHTYTQNVIVPGMVHGRYVRPLGQGAYGNGTNPVPLSIDTSSIKHLPNVTIIHVGNLLGVVAPLEFNAIQAASLLKVTWSTPPAISGSGNLWGQMRTFDSAGQAPASIAFQSGNVASALQSAAKTYSGTFRYHYNMHGPIGPNCAIADVTPAGAIVISHVKDGYGTTRPKIAAVLRLPINQVRVIYAEGASSFGGGAQHVDVGESAAVMSQALGKPVRLQLMRWDEHGWDNYSPATMWDVSGGVDANGNIVALTGTSFGMASYTVTPTESMTSGLTGIALPTGSGNGPADTTYSGTQYTIPNRVIVGKTLPLLNNYFKSSSLRAPNAPQTCFACEQLIDHLAYLANTDPYQFRLQNINTGHVNDGSGQWQDVLVGAAQAANWQPRVATSVKQTGTIRTGRGIALGGFASSQAGVVAEIEVNMRTGKITAKHLYAAQVAGLTVGINLVENQMSGALIMGASRALWEAVAFNKGRVTSLDWVTYPILRLQDTPLVTTVPVQRTDLQATGSGEPPTAPVAGAIANAFFDATGVRITEAPMTPPRVRATLKAAGLA